MKQGDTVILLVDKPGHLRDALQSLLNSRPDLSQVETADTGLLALKKMVEAQPALVLMGHGLPLAEVSELTRQIKQKWPRITCLALAEMTHESESVRLAGVDHVLSSSMPCGQIFAVLQAALQDRADQEKNGSSPGLED